MSKYHFCPIPASAIVYVPYLDTLIVGWATSDQLWDKEKETWKVMLKDHVTRPTKNYCGHGRAYKRIWSAECR